MAGAEASGRPAATSSGRGKSSSEITLRRAEVRLSSGSSEEGEWEGEGAGRRGVWRGYGSREGGVGSEWQVLQAGLERFVTRWRRARR